MPWSMSSGRKRISKPWRSAPTTTWSSAASDIVDAVARADTGSGVIILTDMFGGTPSNLAISVMESGTHRGHRRHEPADADQAVQRAQRATTWPRRSHEAQAAGRKYINVASQLLSGK